jgi:hypothetical protein
MEMEIAALSLVLAHVMVLALEQALALELATQTSMAFVTMRTSTAFVIALDCRLARACRLVQGLAPAAFSARADVSQSRFQQKLAVMTASFFIDLFFQKLKRRALIQLHQVCA